MPVARGVTRHENWDEKPYHERAPQKSTMAEIEIVFEGDLTGKAATRFLMQYPDEAHCHYAGYLLVEGTLGGKTGAMIIYELGTWTDGIAKSAWEIVAASGTGGFKGISGKGQYQAQHDKTVHYQLDYRFD